MILSSIKKFWGNYANSLLWKRHIQYENQTLINYDKLLEKYCDFIKENQSVRYDIEYLNQERKYASWNGYNFVGAKFVNDFVYAIPNGALTCVKYDLKNKKYICVKSTKRSGKFKWTGGCIWNEKLYFFPRSMNSLLILDLKTEEINEIKLEKKYLKEHHYGGVCTSDGRVYQPPRNMNTILNWNLSTEKYKEIRIAPKFIKLRYCGSILHPNGYIYFIPEDGKIIKFNVSTEQWCFIGEKINAMVYDAKVAYDGNIYGFSGLNGILKINVKNDCCEILHKELKSTAYGTKMGINGNIYSIPGQSPYIYEYDIENDKIFSKKIETCDSNNLYAGGTVSKNGSIYMVPIGDAPFLKLTHSIANVDIPNELQMFFDDCY